MKFEHVAVIDSPVSMAKEITKMITFLTMGVLFGNNEGLEDLVCNSEGELNEEGKDLKVLVSHYCQENIKGMIEAINEEPNLSCMLNACLTKEQINKLRNIQ